MAPPSARYDSAGYVRAVNCTGDAGLATSADGVHGRIRDEATGNPIAGATVTCYRAGYQRTVRANGQGLFTIAPLTQRHLVFYGTKISVREPWSGRARRTARRLTWAGESPAKQDRLFTPGKYSARMPKIFEEDGYTFFFYSNEHRPIRVHVRFGGGEAVFDMEPAIDLRESHGLKVQELSKAQGLA